LLDNDTITSKDRTRAPTRGVAIYTTDCGEQTAARSQRPFHANGKGDRSPKSQEWEGQAACAALRKSKERLEA